jgi:hypothetical protein
MKYFFTFIILFVARVVFSQAEFEPGYVITNEGDTLKGKIKDRKYTSNPANPDKIRFIDTAGVEISYGPDDIKQYCKKGTLFFRVLPIGLESKLKFAEIIEYGDVILFGYVSNSFVSTTADLLSKSGESKKDSKSAMRNGVEYFFQKRKDVNSLMKVKPKDFREIALFYFQDDPELVSKLETGTLKYADIRLVVKTHNELAAAKK